MWTGGIMMNEDGSVLSTGQGGIMRNNPDTGKSGWLLDELEGKPFSSGSYLYRGRSEVPGVLVQPAAFKLD